MDPWVYQPWAVLTNVQVPHWQDGNLVVVILPYVAARDEVAFRTTAKFLASMCVKRMDMAHQAHQKELQIENLRSIKFDPPRVVFKCEDCGEQWDAWVAEDGSLEDQWSCVCTNGQCKSHGSPAMLVPVEEW